MDDRRFQKAFFRQFNRFFMAPAYRLGLGRAISNPVSGYYLLLGTTGRSSGKRLTTPVAYAIRDGGVFVMAGWGPQTSWYLNALAGGRVHVGLADREFLGQAEVVADPGERAIALRRILQNSGLTAFTEGVNPWRATDAELLRNGEHKPVMRISSLSGQPVVAGAFDPGGKGWLVPAGVAAVVIALGMRLRRKS